MRLKATLIFAAFGALAALGVVILSRTSPFPKEAIMMISLAGLSAALIAWFLGPRVTERGLRLGLLMGAAIMLLAQIPFAILVIAAFSLIEMIPAAEILSTFGLIVSAGWVIAAPFQIVAGALAALSVRSLSAESNN